MDTSDIKVKCIICEWEGFESQCNYEYDVIRKMDIPLCPECGEDVE